MKFRRTWKKIIASALAVMMVATSSFTDISSVPVSAQAMVEIITALGDQEAACVTWNAVEGATGYNVYVKAAGAEDSAYTKLDSELIRNYGTYWRADALGLAAGSYVFKVEAVMPEGTVSAESAATGVIAYDRTGFAWVNGSANGAYNADGTLRADAVVLYITEDTKDTVSMDVVTSSKGTTTNAVGLQNILNLYSKGYETRPLDIRLIGKVTDPATTDKGDIVLSGSGDSNRLSCGITLEGVGSDAVAYGWGIRLKNVSNVEIRNIATMMVDSDEGDNIGLQQSNDHVWVHNCDFFYGEVGSDSDQSKGDGALDCKKSTYITFSYNHFYDNGKCNLLGLSEDTTDGLYITYHHNWYDHSDSRHPRVRFYSAHVYNNYYDGNAKYGIGACKGASIFAEGNYFRNCPFPMMTSMQGSDVIADWTTLERDEKLGTFSGETGGTIKAFNNYIEGATSFVSYQENATEFDAYVVSLADEQVPASVTSYAGANTYNNFDTSDIMYAYTAQSPQDAVASVKQYAGRMFGGDFTWEFSEEDDASYAVDTELKNALKNYQSSLVSIGSGVSGSSEETTEEETTTVEETTGEPSGEDGTEETKEASGSSSSVYVQNFTTDGIDSTFFIISGNLSDSKGTVEYNGMTLTQCLKIEKSTSISFTTEADATLTLVFNSDFSKNIKIDGNKTTVTAGVLSVDIAAGEHTITKGDTANLYYMEVKTAGSEEETTTEAATDETTTAEETTTVEETTTAEETTTVEETTTAPVVVEVPSEVKAGDIFVAPGADGDGSSADSPMDFSEALVKVSAGNTIWMVAGTYTCGETIVIEEANAGTEDAYKSIVAYGGAAVLDFSSQALDSANRGLILDGSYWHIYGVTFKGAGDNGMLLSGDNNIIEMCVFTENRDTGLQISRYNTSYDEITEWPSNNLIKNCTSFNNCDASGENADGFAAKLTCGEGNVFDGCMSYNNSDDGWDLYAKTATGPIGVVTIKNCIAFRNGKLTNGEGSASGDMNGFKLGGSGVGTPHVIINCLAFENGACGFTDNNNPTAIRLTNCTAYNNSIYANKSNFNLYREAGGVNENILSINFNGKNTGDAFVGTIANSIYYNKDVKGYLYVTDEVSVTKDTMKKQGTKIDVNSSDFVLVNAPDTTTDFHTAWRNADGSINTHEFLEIASESPLATMASDGGSFGARLSGVVTETPDEEEEATLPEVEAIESVDSKISVWDFGAEQFDETVYNNMLSADIINSWYPGVAAGTTGQTLASFAVGDEEGNTLFAFNDGGYSATHRLRTINTALTRKDEKSLKNEAGEVAYTGYIYSNKSATDTVNVQIALEAGDILTVAVASNGTDSVIIVKAPDGSTQSGTHTLGSSTASTMTFYAKEAGLYTIYSANEKLVFARAYIEHTQPVNVVGYVSAPDTLNGEYSVVFTNATTGEAVEAAVENGAYAAV
ncbi:MAG: right-handed parallel beta-helix repeat-containing protein, partial [Lachnospiraceae bacterium]